MITGKLNLAELPHVMMDAKGKSGKVRGIFIPLENGRLFEGKKGAVYLDIIAFENKTDFGTHLVKQSLSKDEREKMSDEQKREMPIIGNLDDSSGFAEANNDAGNGKTYGDDTDLPF